MIMPRLLREKQEWNVIFYNLVGDEICSNISDNFYYLVLNITYYTILHMVSIWLYTYRHAHAHIYKYTIIIIISDVRLLILTLGHTASGWLSRTVFFTHLGHSRSAVVTGISALNFTPRSYVI